MSANFTPVQQAIKNMRPFRFWCQKVLPTVYDDSLSYYELLTKVVNYLNDTVDNVDALNTNVENIYNAYILLQNYVNDYFDNNLPQLVSDKLDSMAEDGTLTALIRAYIDPYFEAKSDEIDGAIASQNSTISTAIERQDSAISTAIQRQDNTINTAIASQNSTISTAIQNQNNTISTAIQRQDDTIAQAIDDQNDEIDTTLGNQNANILVLESRMDAFINNHAGLVGHTTLWQSSTPAVNENSQIALSGLVGDYTFIDVYFVHRGRTAIQRFSKADVISADGFYVRDTQFTVASGDTPQLYPFLRPLQMKLVHTVTTNSVLTITESSEYEWDGSSASNAMSGTNPSSTGITKIVGVNLVQSDSEVADARVDENGTVYATLEARLNAEFSAVKGEIANADQYSLSQTGNAITQRLNLLKNGTTVSPSIPIDADHASKNSNNLVTSNAVFNTVKVIKNTSEFVPYDPATVSGIAVRIEPNIYYEFGYAGSISLSYPPTVVEDDGSIKDYYFTFIVPDGRTVNLTLPSGVVMQTGFNPTGGHKYEIHISNELAKFAEFNI